MPVEYREIPNFPGYRAGSDGSIWGCRKSGSGFGKSGEWRQLATSSIPSSGRLVVGLYRERKKHTLQVHVLVMLAFKGPCPIGLEVCHENGDHTDNRFSNLRYDTHIANEADKERHGRKLLGDRHPVAKLNADTARQVRDAVAAGGTLQEVADRFGVSKKTILNVRDRKVWKWVE